MDRHFVTRFDDARRFTTTPTDELRFLCQGGASMPDVMFERISPGDGPPLHSHPWAAWDVLVRGALRYHVDGEEYDLGPGDFIYVPADAVHSFMGIGDGVAEIVQYQWPGGFQHAYVDIAAAFEGGKPNFDKLAQAADTHGFTIHGPPLAAR